VFSLMYRQFSGCIFVNFMIQVVNAPSDVCGFVTVNRKDGWCHICVQNPVTISESNSLTASCSRLSFMCQLKG
jgi:hypothetical protein